MNFFTTILCMAACSLLSADDSLLVSSTDTTLAGTVEKGHCHRGKRGHRGKKGPVGPIGPQGPGIVSEYMNATFTPPTSPPPPFDTADPLPLGTASLISSGLSYDGVNTVTVQVPGKYLVQYSIEFSFGGESSQIEIDTEYGAGGASVVEDAFPILFGRDEGAYITGTRDRILDLQQNDIVRLRAYIIEGSSLYPDSNGTNPAIIFTMSRVG